MIGSPRFLAMTAANEAVAGTQRENEVMTAAVADLAEYRAATAERKVFELYSTCTRCRTNPCDAMWEEFRVCEECLRVLTDKYDRQPAPVRGDYLSGFQAGKADAYLEMAQWAQGAMRDGH